MNNKANWISLVALLVLVTALPLYGMFESQRMAQAQVTLREQYISNAIELYIQNCAHCHGADGVGIGVMPSLNNPALAEAQPDLLFKTIARAAHGASMAAWHIDEGGILNDYQVEELVALIQYGDWGKVQQQAVVLGFVQPLEPVADLGMAYLEIEDDEDPHQVEELVALIQYGDWGKVQQQAAVLGFVQPLEPVADLGMAYLEIEDDEDPHQCIDCHEEPEMHESSFGVNCARCHNTLAWAPAALTRHDFLLDHGGEGEVSCETCHPANYVQYDCYACHTAHQAEEMATVHAAEQTGEYADCARCHPTGIEGEADKLRDLDPDAQANALFSELLTVGIIK